MGMMKEGKSMRLSRRSVRNGCRKFGEMVGQ